MMIVKLESEEQKLEGIRRKRNLKGRRERIMENWKERKERKMRWKLEEIAKEEEGKGRKVWIGYGKIRIEEEEEW